MARAEGNEMAGDAEWVEDVKRWTLAGLKSSPSAEPIALDSEFDALGYEAAHPALQARHWPDASPTFIDSR